MTARKHLKARIRTRMQKTGERYSTARRFVLGEKLETLELGPKHNGAATHHLPGAVPATTALRILLTHAGVRHPATGQPLSEAMVFGMAGGIGIGVFSFFYEKANVASFFVAGRHNWFDDVAYFDEALTSLGIKPVVQEATSVKKAEQQLRALLEQCPVIAWVDMTLLPHRAMPQSMTGGGYHVITVYRIDDAKQQALIGDLTDEPIWIGLKELAIARERIKKQKNRLLSIPPQTRKPDLNRLVREGIKHCHHGLVNAGMAKVKTNFRLEALGLWADRLHGSDGKEAWEHVFATPANKWTALLSINDFIEHYGTGGGLCRPLFADFLAEAATTLGQPRLQAVATRYAELGRSWSLLADAALDETVHPFRVAKKQKAKRAELLHAGGPPEKLREAWQRLEEIQQGCFPLSDVQWQSLLGELQERVRALHAEEVQAHEELGCLLN